ncbi:hypothetical protein [Compostibacter hankyongensis]|uniref:Uncharacterized protein n=1 Tax=Compostibacter hankyongensis TaxID=1007089 RepID=A0ABP8FDQ6_9BACT
MNSELLGASKSIRVEGIRVNDLFVPETLAQNVTLPGHSAIKSRRFSHVDLWNIQRRLKTARRTLSL